MIKIKTTVPKRGFHLSIVIALVSSLISFVATPAMAAPYDGTSGDVSCTTGFFTITSNVVTSHTGCADSAVIPEGVTAIGDQAFYRGAAATLTSVTLPSTLVDIGQFAFWTVPLTSITIPGKVTRIQARAFADSQSLTNITFLNGTATTLSIGYAFYNARFTSITLPPRLTSLRLNAFDINPNIQRINFLGTEPSVTGNFSSILNSPTVYANSSAGFSASGTPVKWKGLNFISVDPPAFSYASSPQTASAGTPITTATVTSTGGTITSYSINPAITNTPGLTFDTTTGAIAGTPTQVAASTTYTVTATGTLGATSTSTYAITVNTAPGAQTITFPDLSPITLGGAAPTATATASSNLTVAFTSATTAVCTVTGTTITVLTTGTCTINANQAGNALFLAATQVQKSFLISPVPVVDDGAALAAAAAKRAAEQKELTEILALIPKIGELTLSLGETTKSLYSTKCVKGKSTKFVKKGAKCPKGFVKRK